MDPGGAVASRAESLQSSPIDAIGAVARELAVAQGGSLEAAAVCFPDPDPKTWPADLSSLSAAIGRSVPLRTLSTGNAAALAEIWYGSGKGANDLIAFSIGPSVSA